MPMTTDDPASSRHTRLHLEAWRLYRSPEFYEGPCDITTAGYLSERSVLSADRRTRTYQLFAGGQNWLEVAVTDTRSCGEPNPGDYSGIPAAVVGTMKHRDHADGRREYYLQARSIVVMPVPPGAMSCQTHDRSRLLPSRAVPPASSVPRFQDDDPSSTLDPRWHWVNPLGDGRFSLTQRPGWLRLAVPSGNHDLHLGYNFNAPRLLIPASGDFDVRTHVCPVPIALTSYQAAGILAWFDHQNYVWIAHAINSVIGSVVTLSGRDQQRPEIPGMMGRSVYLRIRRRRDRIDTFYSLDGTEWPLHGSYNATGLSPAASVGVFVLSSHQGAPFAADFEYFQYV